MTEREHLEALVAVSPWEGDRDSDWCHFCEAQPVYGSKPWAGHRTDCVWANARDYLEESE